MTNRIAIGTFVIGTIPALSYLCHHELNNELQILKY